MSDDRNLILALVLCTLVIVTWQIVFGGPSREATVEGPEVAETVETVSGEPGDVPLPSVESIERPGTVGGAILEREDALQQTRRVRIESDTISGSLSLTGARIDDVLLKNYQETLDPDSPNITLLSPKGTAFPYVVDFGWSKAGDAQIDLPTQKTIWTVEQGNTLTPSTPLTLVWDNGTGAKFRRTFELDDTYLFTITDSVEVYGNSASVISSYAQIARYGRPPSRPIFILHEGAVGFFNGGFEKITYKNLIKEKRSQQSSTGGWLGITDKYWLTALLPLPDARVDASFNNYPGKDEGTFTAEYLGTEMAANPGQTVSYTHRLFAGAKKARVLNAYRAAGVERFDLAIDWGMFFFLTKPFFYALDFFAGLIGNFGVGILLVTVAIKLVFFPLANQSYAAMSKMKKVQPEMMKIRERYADDRMKQNQELMELYKREKVNPLAGCLPILIQIPVFYALYKVLYVTIEMRHEPFFGWIQDLSAKDPTTIFNLFGLIPWAPPEFLIIGIWPLIMGFTMYLQTALNPAPTDPIQEKVFQLMPILFTVLLASFPAGLVIYWAWNNALSILQQYVIMKRMGVEVDLAEKFKLPSWVSERVSGLKPKVQEKSTETLKDQQSDNQSGNSSEDSGKDSFQGKGEQSSAAKKDDASG